jgi:hypothetical protein
MLENLILHLMSLQIIEYMTPFKVNLSRNKGQTDNIPNDFKFN